MRLANAIHRCTAIVTIAVITIASPVTGSSAPVGTPVSASTPQPSGASVTMDGADAQLSNHFPGPAPDGAWAPTRTWLEDHALYVPPLVTPELVIAFPGRSGIHAFDRRTGEERWRLPDMAILAETSPAIAGDTLFVLAAEQGIQPGIVAIEVATGAHEMLPVSFIPDPTSGRRLIVVGETLLVPVLQGIMAIDASTGKQRWQFDLPEPGRIESSVLASEMRVVFTWGPFSAGEFRLTALELATGELAWERTARPWVSTIAGESLIGKDDGTIVGTDLAGGDVVWSIPSPFARTDGIATDGTSLVVVGDAGAAEFEIATGKIRWRAELPLAEDVGGEIVIAGETAVTFREGQVVIIDRASGEILQEFALQATTGGTVELNGVAIIDGVAYAGTGSGLVAYAGADDSTTMLPPISSGGFVSPSLGYTLSWDPAILFGTLEACNPGTGNQPDIVVIRPASLTGPQILGFVYAYPMSHFATGDPLQQQAREPMVETLRESDRGWIRVLDESTVSMVLPEDATMVQFAFDDPPQAFDDLTGFLIHVPIEGNDDVALFFELYVETEQMTELLLLVEAFIAGTSRSAGSPPTVCPDAG